MKAMILAAGMGTRLKPLTDHQPKALVEINGTPMLELLIRRLITFGFRDIIINVHHFADQIIDFIRTNNNFGVNIRISQEDQILETGGGIKKAAYFFKDVDSFLVHNVDVLTNLDLLKFFECHISQNYLSTLAVMQRETSRQLIVDEQNFVCGHVNKKKNEIRIVREPTGNTNPLAFSGVHVISTRIFELLEKQGYFSIIDAYVRLISESQIVKAYPMNDFYWKDLGNINNIKEAEMVLRQGTI